MATGYLDILRARHATRLLVGTLVGVAIGLISGFVVYGALKATVGIRLSEEQEFNGADVSIHKISSTPDEDITR